MELKRKGDESLNFLFKMAESMHWAVIQVNSELNILRMSSGAREIINAENIGNIKKLFSEDFCQIVATVMENKTEQRFLEEFDEKEFVCAVTGVNGFGIVNLQPLDGEFLLQKEMPEPYQHCISRMLIATDLLIRNTKEKKPIKDEVTLEYLSNIKQDTYRMLRLSAHSAIERMPLRKTINQSRRAHILPFFQDILEKMSKVVTHARVRLDTEVTYQAFNCDEEKMTTAVYAVLNELFEHNLYDVTVRLTVRKEILTVQILTTESFEFSDKLLSFCRKIMVIHGGVVFADDNSLIFKLNEVWMEPGDLRNPPPILSSGLNLVMVEFVKILTPKSYR